jgi:drug/metabolite transporter (DMT)-like permease
MNLFFYKEYKRLSSLTIKDLGILLMIALFGGAIGTLSIVKALFLVNFQDLSIVVLLQKLQPIFAIALASLLLKERLRKNYVIWASLAILAGYFLTFGLSLPNLNTGSSTVYAALFALLAALSFGSSTVFSKMILERYSFYTATFYRYGLTAVIMIIFVLFTGNLIGQLGVTTETEWMIFIIIGLTTGTGAIFLYYYGLNRVNAIIATICELFFPVSAIFFDYIINGNKLSVVQWLSAFIMIYAIVNLNRSHSKSIEESV